MNVEVLWQKMRKRNMSCTFEATSLMTSRRWGVQASKSLNLRQALFGSMVCQFEMPKYVGIR